MYQEERLCKIIEWLKEEQVLSNQDLMERLNISRDTARRDIIKLTENGSAIRTHGGIANAEFQVYIADYRSRLTQNSKGKEKIGEKAAKYLEENGVYFLDTSTHMPYLCKNLNRSMEVYTHSLDNLQFLSMSQLVEVHSLGGILQKKNRFFYGCDVWEKLSDIHFDAAVLGVAAMGEDGIYFENQEDAQIKGLAARRASKVIVMADFPKFQRISKFRALKLHEIDTLITDRELTKEWKELLKKENVEWVIV